MITKEFQPNATLFYRASREIFHLTSGKRILYGGFIGFVLAITALNAVRGGSTGSISTWVIVVGILVCVFVLMPLFQYQAIRKNVKSNPSASAWQKYEITQNGVRNHGDGFSVDLAWDKITEVRVSKSFVLLFISRNIAYFIPRSLLSEAEIEHIKRWKNDNHEFQLTQ